MQNVHVLHHSVFFQNTTGFRINFPFAFMGISRVVYVPWVNLSIAVAESLESTIYYCSTIEDSKKHVIHCKYRRTLYLIQNRDEYISKTLNTKAEDILKPICKQRFSKEPLY